MIAPLLREPSPSSQRASRRPLTIAMVCDGIGDVVAGSFISTARFSERLATLGHRIVLVSSGSRRNYREREYRGMSIHRLFGLLVPWTDGQLYLAVPLAWRIFGKQFLVVARKAAVVKARA